MLKNATLLKKIWHKYYNIIEKIKQQNQKVKENVTKM